MPDDIGETVRRSPSLRWAVGLVSRVLEREFGAFTIPVNVTRQPAISPARSLDGTGPADPRPAYFERKKLIYVARVRNGFAPASGEALFNSIRAIR